MTADNTHQFQQQYRAGKEALERGQYRTSIEYLEAAKELVSPYSRPGGEVRVWLVTAYQAANKLEEAIALAQELLAHPNAQTREQAQHILYIIKAPILERPREWMSEIPDLAKADSGASRYVTANKKMAIKPAEKELEDLEPSPVDPEDNKFIWFAAILVCIIVGYLVWLGRT